MSNLITPPTATYPAAYGLVGQPFPHQPTLVAQQPQQPQQLQQREGNNVISCSTGCNDHWHPVLIIPKSIIETYFSIIVLQKKIQSTMFLPGINNFLLWLKKKKKMCNCVVSHLLPVLAHSFSPLTLSRTRRLQYLYLSSASGVHRLGDAADVSALR